MRSSGGSGALLSAKAACSFGRTSKRVDDAGELDQEAVAGRLDDAALVTGDLRVDDFGAQRLQPPEGAFLVGFDQARIAGDIGRKDRREPTFDASWPGGLHRTSSVADDPTPASALRALSMRPTDAARHIVVQI
jgi:hypothetical protein